MKDMDRSDIATLEAFVDSYGIAGVLTALSWICSEKAEHCAVNWQDVNLAKRWMSNSKDIDRINSSVEGRGL